MLFQAWSRRYAYGPILTELQPSRGGSAHRSALLQQLRYALSQVKAESPAQAPTSLLSRVVNRAKLPERLDFQEVAEDIYQIYDVALTFYARGIAPERSTLVMAERIGYLRNRYAAYTPYIISLASIQFRQTRHRLLTYLSSRQQAHIISYLEAIDDHLYLPLGRVYEAAAVYPPNAQELITVRRLIPLSGKIARKIVERVQTAFPHYHSYSGPLSSSLVKAASIRDVELFQAYLWLCILECSDAVLTQELLPLCQRLYPILNIRWELVRYMLLLLEHEIGRRSEPHQWQQFRPYIDRLRNIFAGVAAETLQASIA